jgi:hypothetical protein
MFSCRKGDSPILITIVPGYSQLRCRVCSDFEAVLDVPFERDGSFPVPINDQP